MARTRITRVQQVKVDIQAIGDRLLAVNNFQRQQFTTRVKEIMQQGYDYVHAKVMVKEEMRIKSLPINKLFKNE